MLEKVYKQIDIEKIKANENQPRTIFDDEKIAWYEYNDLEQIEHSYCITIHKA